MLEIAVFSIKSSTDNSDSFQSFLIKFFVFIGKLFSTIYANFVNFKLVAIKLFYHEMCRVAVFSLTHCSYLYTAYSHNSEKCKYRDIINIYFLATLSLTFCFYMY